MAASSKHSYASKTLTSVDHLSQKSVSKDVPSHSTGLDFNNNMQSQSSSGYNSRSNSHRSERSTNSKKFDYTTSFDPKYGTQSHHHSRSNSHRSESSTNSKRLVHSSSISHGHNSSVESKPNSRRGNRRVIDLRGKNNANSDRLIYSLSLRLGSNSTAESQPNSSRITPKGNSHRSGEAFNGKRLVHGKTLHFFDHVPE